MTSALLLRIRASARQNSAEGLGWGCGPLSAIVLLYRSFKSGLSLVPSWSSPPESMGGGTKVGKASCLSPDIWLITTFYRPSSPFLVGCD